MVVVVLMVMFVSATGRAVGSGSACGWWSLFVGVDAFVGVCNR